MSVARNKTSQTARHLLVLTITMLGVCAYSAQGSAANRVYKNKYAAFIMDADTGMVLHRENENKALHPASLTKMMTLMMVFDALERRKLKRYTRVRISKHAASMIPSKLDLPVGSSIKVEDAIKALVTKSANDVAVALAEKLGGTEQNFAQMMTRKAHSIGMTQTVFRNASGLHDPRQKSTARDMAKLARILITDYPKYYHYFSLKSFTYRGKTYKSHNKLNETYAGMDGLKTGYVRASGFNLASSAKRGDHRLIGVVFGGKTGRSRNAQMAQLMDKSFAKMKNVYIARNAPVPQKKPEIDIELAAVEPASSHDERITAQMNKAVVYTSRWDMLDQHKGDSMIDRMIGQGDYDIHVRNRIETGLMAISAYLGQDIPYEKIEEKPTSVVRYNQENNDWGIQIGAFTTKNRTNKAISNSLDTLPHELRLAKSVITPVDTDEGQIYRARLYGYSKNAAYRACNILKDCIPLSPTQTF